jgi:hypothetical protein
MAEQKEGSRNRIAKTGHPERDMHNRTDRQDCKDGTGLPGRDRTTTIRLPGWDRTTRIRRTGQGRRDGADRMGQTEQDCQDRTARAVQPQQDGQSRSTGARKSKQENPDKTVGTGQPGHSRNWTAGTRQSSKPAWTEQPEKDCYQKCPALKARLCPRLALTVHTLQLEVPFYGT